MFRQPEKSVYACPSLGATQCRNAQITANFQHAHNATCEGVASFSDLYDGFARFVFGLPFASMLAACANAAVATNTVANKKRFMLSVLKN